MENGDALRASQPIVDGNCVRFAIFLDVRGPQVFEITATTLARCFGARGHGADELLRAFQEGRERIDAAARTHRGRHAVGAIRLTDAEFSSPGGAASGAS